MRHAAGELDAANSDILPHATVTTVPIKSVYCVYVWLLVIGGSVTVNKIPTATQIMCILFQM